MLLNKSKLPDVDISLPDTFETADIKEEVVKENVDFIKENENENIDKTAVVSKEAFSKFADKTFSTADEDYSESVVVRRRVKRGGFIQNQTDFELADVNSDETPLQRFHRLQFEVKKFLEDIREKKIEKDVVEKPEQIDPNQMAEELNILQSQLVHLLKDETVQPILNPKYELEQTAKLQEGLSKKLLNELNNFAKIEPLEASTTKNEKSGCVTYELYYTPNTSKQLQSSKLAELEKRLSDIENLVGINKLIIPNVNLVEAVEQLKENLSILTIPQIETIQQTINTVSKDMDLLLQKQKSFQTKTINEKKINQIFEIMTKWDETNDQLPLLVSRLKSLKSLHEEAASFSRTVKDLELQQEEMKKLLKSDAEILKQLEEGFKKNLNLIQNNFTSLDNRITSLTKKIEDSVKSKKN